MVGRLAGTTSAKLIAWPAAPAGKRARGCRALARQGQGQAAGPGSSSGGGHVGCSGARHADRRVCRWALPSLLGMVKDQNLLDNLHLSAASAVLICA